MKTITLILIAILVALGVCVLADGLSATFLTGGPIRSILIAVAGALAITLLLAMVKSLANLKLTHAILGSLLGALLLLVIAFLFRDRTACNSSASALITCEKNHASLDNHHIEVCPDGKVTWNLGGDPNAKVHIFEFRKRKYLHYPDVQPQPLKKNASTANDYEGIVGGPPISDDVNGVVGHFRYKITCKPPDGPLVIVDPMIDIPKR